MDQAPTPNTELPFKKLTKNFNVKSNKGHDYLISMETGSSYSLILNAKYQDKLNFRYYYSIKKIEDIKKNKYFLMFETIEEIFTELSNLIDNSKPIIFEETNSILLSILLPSTKIKEIIFEIKEKEKTDKEKIEELYLIISNLKTQILNNNNGNDLHKEIIELKNKIEQQNNEIKELKEKINENEKKKEKEIEELKKTIKENKKKTEILIEYKNKKEEEKKSKKIINLNSKIIRNNEKKYNQILKNWINPNKKIEIKSELLYRLSENGNSYQEFHEKCDNKGPTLILIEAVEGFITGGYTPLSWDSYSQWKQDKDTFLFSLTLNKKFIKEDVSDSILCLESYGPWFDNFGFELNSRKKFMRECKFQTGNAFINANDIIVNDGNNKFFEVKEVEVFKIEFY